MVRTSFGFLARTFWLAVCLGAPARAADLQVVAPAIPGSSWDQVAQVVKAAAAALPGGTAFVTNVPGSSGTVGLARFVAEAGDDALLVTGSTMLAGTLVHRSPVTLEGMTPIARLAAEPFAVVVPAESPLRTVSDLRGELGTDAARVGWAGGPVGGVDHVATIRLAEAFGVDPAKLNYAPFLTSAEAAAAVAENRVGVAVLALGEVAADLDGGRLRALAVAAEARMDGVDAPTLAEGGIDLEIANWRGLVARPGLPPERQGEFASLAADVLGTADLRAILARKRWRSAFLPPAEFGAFIRGEHARAKRALKAAGILKRTED